MSNTPRPAMQGPRAVDDEDFALPLTPLIDIVFLLIIFFLLATTFVEVEKDIAIQLPPAATGHERRKATESIVINGERDVFTAVVVRGDKRASHGSIVEVLDLCKKARIRNIAVATFERADAD